jgi:hypothetical protein
MKNWKKVIVWGVVWQSAAAIAFDEPMRMIEDKRLLTMQQQEKGGTSSVYKVDPTFPIRNQESKKNMAFPTLATPVDSRVDNRAPNLKRKSIWTAYVSNNQEAYRQNKLRTTTETIPLIKGSGLENLTGFQAHKPNKGLGGTVGIRWDH